MELSSILQPAAVRVVSQMSSKKRLFQELGDCAAGAYELSVAHAIDALLEREALGPTGFGQGVALPHARLTGVDKVVGVFFRIERPLDFSAVDRQPVDLVFALFAPENSGVEHLKSLALVSRTMRNAAICAKLRANSDPAILHTILTEGPATKAA